MGHNDHIDFDLHELIQDLIDEGELEENSDAHGVARQVIHQGYDSLSPKQRTLYDAVVVPALKRRGEEVEMIQRMNSAPD
ncbi:MAG TPA: hypothetical protein VGO06_27985 [Bosea sp. (in: a-proteobacteria)]|jgi:hypothetical protein|uniref:hypothetical protein n=1 Tax=Bosea sp. (in: a-proteobacteria) TaxID=1871050 RepID=UPI002E0F448D|nr:hypothetical protein [Bosea sp. (in: a-proteobacteria)]